MYSLGGGRIQRERGTCVAVAGLYVKNTFAQLRLTRLKRMAVVSIKKRDFTSFPPWGQLVCVKVTKIWNEKVNNTLVIS